MKSGLHWTLSWPLIAVSLAVVVYVAPLWAQDDGNDFDETAFLADEGDAFDADAFAGDESKAGTAGMALDIHGAFENQLTPMMFEGVDNQLHLGVYDYVQLRLDIDASLPGGIELKSDGVARLFAGDTELKVSTLLPRATVLAAMADDPATELLLADSYRFENDVYVDNVYVKIPIGGWLLTLGKQPLAQGAGYVWNPTDVFTRKDMLDPTYQKEGIIGVKLTAPVNDALALTLIGAPEKKMKNWKSGGRADLRIGPVSLGAAGYAQEETRTDYVGSLPEMMAALTRGSDPMDELAVRQYHRVMAGGDVVADIKGVRLWAEGAYNWAEGSVKNWWELSSGFEYFFTFETHLMVEYFHYGRGAVPHNGMYRLNAWFGALGGESAMLGRDFLFESIDHPVADFWTLGLSSFQSLTDGSALVTADAKWDFAQDAQLWLMVAAGVGEQNDFLVSPRAQGWTRITVFF